MWEVVSDYAALEEEGARCTCKDRLVSYKGERKKIRVRSINSNTYDSKLREKMTMMMKKMFRLKFNRSHKISHSNKT